MGICDKPLGLPEGSVRALITIGLVGASLYAVLKGVILPEWIISSVTLIIGFYFGTRKKP